MAQYSYIKAPNRNHIFHKWEKKKKISLRVTCRVNYKQFSLSHNTNLTYFCWVIDTCIVWMFCTEHLAVKLK